MRHGNKKLSCKFLECAAGGGVVHNGKCMLGGDWENPDCNKIKTESQFKRWLKNGMQKI